MPIPTAHSFDDLQAYIKVCKLHSVLFDETGAIQRSPTLETIAQLELTHAALYAIIASVATLPVDCENTDKFLALSARPENFELDLRDFPEFMLFKTLPIPNTKPVPTMIADKLLSLDISAKNAAHNVGAFMNSINLVIPNFSQKYMSFRYCHDSTETDVFNAVAERGVNSMLRDYCLYAAAMNPAGRRALHHGIVRRMPTVYPPQRTPACFQFNQFEGDFHTYRETFMNSAISRLTELYEFQTFMQHRDTRPSPSSETRASVQRAGSQGRITLANASLSTLAKELELRESGRQDTCLKEHSLAEIAKAMLAHPSFPKVST